jgi:4-amino-4-deoxy-L-arabinose transferase-like glycosyltransferase
MAPAAAPKTGRPASQSTALPDARTLTRWAIVSALGLCALQLLAASRLELMFDEAYYGLWSKHLNWGYYDHPPMVAAWIWLSTALFGDTELGMRLLGIMATLAGAWALHAIAQDLFGDPLKSAFAALLWTATPLVGVGAILVTPDTPLMVGWTTALWALARLHRTEDWRWWLLVGVAAGIALEAKYTALFLGPGIVLAMLALPRWRRWWRHPAPYVGGVLALALFAPNILWNARNGWQTFIKQFGRVGDTEWTLRFLGEFLGSQLGLLNPLTFVLAIAGLWLAVRGPSDSNRDARRLLACLVAPLLAYFLFHSLHDRVQGNWMAPLYPALILLAADAGITGLAQPLWAGRLVAVARSWAWPTGLVMLALVYTQALLTPLPLKPQSDPTTLMSGWRDLARDLDALAAREGAATLLTQSYALTALLRRYAPGQRAVLQYNERSRWTYDPTATLLRPDAPMLFVVEQKRTGSAAPLDRFAEAREVARVHRTRRGTVLETYVVYRASRPIMPILDPVVPPTR